MAKAVKNKGGRKPLWEVMDMPSKLESVRGWAMQGSTDEEIYTMLEISKDTFYKWKKEFPEFAEALKKGKNISNGELINSAFKQSVGFEYVEEQAIKVKDWKKVVNPETEKEELVQYERVEVIPVVKVAPPNPTMNIFMLKNRLPEMYKDKQEIGHSGEIANKIDVSGLTLEELKNLAKRRAAETD